MTFFLFPADCIKVPTVDLISPGDQSLFRKLTPVHIQELKNEIARNPRSNFTLMVVNVPNSVDLRQVKTPGAYKYEVLGGNHTRAAIQALLNENPGDERFAYWPVRLYAGLNIQQCLSIGNTHNRMHQFILNTSFAEYVQLFRKELFRLAGKMEGVDDTPELPFRGGLMEKWKSSLCGILHIPVRMIP